MKIFSKFLYLATALAFVAVSCVKPEPAVEPGPQEVEGCYGVYFPAQDASGSHILSPSDKTEFDITLKRTVAEGAITVPIITSFSENGIFNVADASFADGQDETTFKVSFPTIDQGKTYNASFRIEDNKYASIYTSNATGLDFSIMQVEMKDFLTEDKSKKAMITFSDDVFWGEVHDDVYLEYYEVDGVRYCQTTGGKLVGEGSDGVGPWGTDVQLSFKWYTNLKVEWEGVEYDFIEVPGAFHGWQSGDGIDIWYGDYYHMLVNMGLSTGGTTSSYQYYTLSGDKPCYYDGHGGFIFSLSYWLSGTTRWYGFQENAPVGIAEGYLRVDYSFDAESDFSVDGVSPVYLTAGADVASVKYQLYEGALNGAQIEAKIAAIPDDDQAVTITDELVLDEDTAKKYATLEFEPEASGYYTFVALAYDESGKVQNSASVSFKNISKGDVEDHKVDINAFCEDTPARYTSLHDYDSFAYGVYGTNLTEVHVGIFTEATVAKYGSDFILDQVKFDYDGDFAVTEEELEQINAEGGYYDVLTKLTAKTTYYVIVWATNGDLDEFAIDYYTTNKLPYVWNSLGKGQLTDGFIMSLFSRPDYTVSCDVYEEANTPGLYMINNYQLELISLFFNETQETMAQYEGANWIKSDLIVDATDPNKVFIEEQDYGLLVNSSYGFMLIEADPTGTLANGEITWPARNMYVGMPVSGAWYYANSNGTFKITLPSAVSPAPAPAAVPAGDGVVNDVTISTNARMCEREKVVYERDAKTATNVSVSVSNARRPIVREERNF